MKMVENGTYWTLMMTCCELWDFYMECHETRGEFSYSWVSLCSSSSSSSSRWGKGSDDNDTILFKITRLSLLDDNTSWSWKWLYLTRHTLQEKFHSSIEYAAHFVTRLHLSVSRLLAPIEGIGYKECQATCTCSTSSAHPVNLRGALLKK
jgi:hypothetical protein